MEANNLIFSSSVDSKVEDVCFGILMDYFKNDDYRSVYVTDVCLAPDEIIFLACINGKNKIIIRINTSTK